jgi:hypothetical protein
MQKSTLVVQNVLEAQWLTPRHDVSYPQGPAPGNVVQKRTRAHSLRLTKPRCIKEKERAHQHTKQRKPVAHRVPLPKFCGERILAKWKHFENQPNVFAQPDVPPRTPGGLTLKAFRTRVFSPFLDGLGRFHDPLGDLEVAVLSIQQQGRPRSGLQPARPTARGGGRHVQAARPISDCTKESIEYHIHPSCRASISGVGMHHVYALVLYSGNNTGLSTDTKMLRRSCTRSSSFKHAQPAEKRSQQIRLRLMKRLVLLSAIGLLTRQELMPPELSVLVQHETVALGGQPVLVHIGRDGRHPGNGEVKRRDGVPGAGAMNQ